MTTPLPIEFSHVAAEIGITAAQVTNVMELADAGNTVPFITRYRKEQTGNLDEEQIRSVLARVAAARDLEERRATVMRQIEDQGKLSAEVRIALLAADSLKRLEDLYAPFRPRKRTRTAIARERGLEPLAELI